MHTKIRAFCRQDEASTAVEFSLLIFPFMLLVIALIELSLYFATATVMEGALVDVVRSIRTGDIQEEASLQAMEDRFVEEVCDHAGYIARCGDIEYEVRKLDSFASDASVNITSEGQLDSPAFEMDQVTAGCVVMVRLVYGYHFMTPFFAELWSNYPDEKRLIMATSVVKTEPYDFNASANCEIS